MGGNWRLAEAIQGGAIARTRSFVARSPLRPLSTAIARLAEVQHPDPAEEQIEAIDQGQRGPERQPHEPSVMKDGLSLPGRAWIVVGAAAAMWALVAAFLLLIV